MATKTTCPSPLMHTKFESQEWLKYFAITHSTWPNSLFRSALFNSEINAWWPNALRIACVVQWPDILGFPNAHSNFRKLNPKFYIHELSMWARLLHEECLILWLLISTILLELFWCFLRQIQLLRRCWQTKIMHLSILSGKRNILLLKIAF